MDDSLMLSADIYPEIILKKAIDDYDAISKIRYERVGAYWKCTFEAGLYAINTVMKEFENYLIDLLNVIE